MCDDSAGQGSQLSQFLDPEKIVVLAGRRNHKI
jgi:hypothetical protein